MKKTVNIFFILSIAIFVATCLMGKEIISKKKEISGLKTEVERAQQELNAISMLPSSYLPPLETSYKNVTGFIANHAFLGLSFSPQGEQPLKGSEILWKYNIYYTTIRVISTLNLRELLTFLQELESRFPVNIKNIKTGDRSTSEVELNIYGTRKG